MRSFARARSSAASLPPRPLVGRGSRAGQVVDAVTAVLAHGLDRTREIADTARIIEAASAGVVLTRGGDTLPLPGLPEHRLLAPGSRILATAARELADTDTYVTFLAPTTDSYAGDGRLVRVSALDCARPPLDHLRAAVLLPAPGDLRGLTPLDLRVLGLLVEGEPRVPAIAAGLGVDERTAADALRASLLALQAPNRTAATMHALRTGLRTPAAGHPRVTGPDIPCHVSPCSRCPLAAHLSHLRPQRSSPVDDESLDPQASAAGPRSSA